jgi:hypothetical protein
MKKYMIAISIAFSALFGLSAQAAPLTVNTPAVQSQVAQDSATTKVYWRRGYGWRGYGVHRGYGWRGGYGWRRPYYGYGVHRGYGWRGGYGWRRPYYGYGVRRYGWRPYGVYGGCRLRCNPWRCWRVCW